LVGITLICIFDEQTKTKDMVTSSNQVFTKRGNRNFAGLRPKTMSRQRYGILINYYDWYARKIEVGVNLSNSVDCIKDLYYRFYDGLKGYTSSAPYGYIKSREVLINPVGGLRAYRYFLTDNGKKRLEQLRRKYKK
jgi:hypothetical protein